MLTKNAATAVISLYMVSIENPKNQNSEVAAKHVKLVLE